MNMFIMFIEDRCVKYDVIAKMASYYMWLIADFCVSRVRPRFSGLITGEMLGQRLALTRAVWSDLVTWEMLIQSVAGEMMV